MFVPRARRLIPWLVLVWLLLVCVPAAMAGERVTIRYLAHTTNQLEIALYKDLAASFQARRPDIEVEILTPSGPWLEQLKVMIAGGAAPDAIFTANWWIPELVHNNLVYDITEIAARDPEWNDSDFFPVMIEQTFYQGRRWAVPRHFSPMLIYFNRSLFEEVGLGDPPDGWSWEEFKEYARRLTRRGDDSSARWGVGSFQSEALSGNAFLIPLVRSFGGDLFSQDGLYLELASPTSVNAVQWFIDLTLQDGVSPSLSDVNAHRGHLVMMVDQKLGMLLDIFYRVMQLRDAEVAFDWDLANLPVGPAGRVNRAAGGTHAVVRTTQHPLEAWEWIKFLASSEAQRSFAANGLVMGARFDSAISDILMQDNVPPANLRLFMDAALDARPYPMTPFYNQAVAALQPALAAAWAGEKSFQAAIEEVKDSVERILQQ